LSKIQRSWQLWRLFGYYSLDLEDECVMRIILWICWNHLNSKRTFIYKFWNTELCCGKGCWARLLCRWWCGNSLSFGKIRYMGFNIYNPLKWVKTWLNGQGPCPSSYISTVAEVCAQTCISVTSLVVGSMHPLLLLEIN
jgi:hypothetical protein